MISSYPIIYLQYVKTSVCRFSSFEIYYFSEEFSTIFSIQYKTCIYFSVISNNDLNEIFYSHSGTIKDIQENIKNILE
jgi:hypothetical protein